MSIGAYLEPRFSPATRLRVPGGLGSGIRVEGQVLEGRTSVEEAQLRDRIRGLSSDAKERALANASGVEQRGYWVTGSEK